jgi:hypothetical protein
VVEIERLVVVILVGGNLLVEGIELSLEVFGL